MSTTTFEINGEVFFSEKGVPLIRLQDNRKAKFASALMSNARKLIKGEKIAVDVKKTRNGLFVVDIKAGKYFSANSTKTPMVDRRSVEQSLPAARPPILSEAQKFYQEAAVARTEGRFSAAREYFELALDAGAGQEIYIAYAKMLLGRGSNAQLARGVLQRALSLFPDDATFYVMYGQMERRLNNLSEAERIIRAGLSVNTDHSLLKWSLGQVLAEIATAPSLREAGTIFDSLEASEKLNKHDISYVRFRALASNPRAGRAYSFLDKLQGFRPAIAGRKELSAGISDLVVEISSADLEASFGISGAYLVRCFDGTPKRSDITDLANHLRSLKSDSTVGLINGRDVLINASMAFVVVPSATGIRDFLMSILSERDEALLPIDENLMRSNSSDGKTRLKEILSHYLGSRDLYDSTLPVSGRRLFGRERLIVQLAEQTSRGEFIGVFGLRKMGKTSLIYQLRDEKLRSEAVAYVDLQASPGFSSSSFLPVLWEIERDLIVKLSPIYPKVKQILRLGAISRYSDASQGAVNLALLFSEDMRELLDAIISGLIPGVKRIVIILDELERCLPLAGQKAMEGYIEFFSLLRGLAQTERYRGSLSSVVVAANPAISETAYWEGRENPVFSLYKPLFLPPLMKSDATQMIRELGKGMSVYWDADAIELIYEECGGHPFLTRMLCSQISQNHAQRPLNVTRKMVHAEIPVFIRDKHDKFEQITELLHSHFPSEESFLESLALGQATLGVTDEAISHLIGYQLIERDREVYRIKFNALRMWLRRRAGVLM